VRRLAGVVDDDRGVLVGAQARLQTAERAHGDDAVRCRGRSEVDLRERDEAADGRVGDGGRRPADVVGAHVTGDELFHEPGEPGCDGDDAVDASLPRDVGGELYGAGLSEPQKVAGGDQPERRTRRARHGQVVHPAVGHLQQHGERGAVRADGDGVAGHDARDGCVHIEALGDDTTSQVAVRDDPHESLGVRDEDR